MQCLELAQKRERLRFISAAARRSPTAGSLTAAHCLPSFISTLSRPLRNSKGELHDGRLEVVLGSGDLTIVPPERVFPVAQVVIDED